jgi:hypothetical protein
LGFSIGTGYRVAATTPDSDGRGAKEEMIARNLSNMTATPYK